MKKLIIIFCLYYFPATAQYKQSLWCFGDSAGIDFSGINPAIFLSYSSHSRGSCASICDVNDSLLFYVVYNNSVAVPSGNVFDKNNLLIQNGDSLNGFTTYQQVIIVPLGNINTQQLFYIFHLDIVPSSPGHGLYYSIVDMNQNGGTGAVVSKNVQLSSVIFNDHIDAVKHCNGRDWWIVMRPYLMNPTNAFYIYLVTPYGVTGPNIQYIGSNVVTNLCTNKFSQDGNKLVFTDNGGRVDLFDFDRSTGVFSNYQNIDQTPFDICGAEFSPGGRYLYVGNTDNYAEANPPWDTTCINPYRCYQYDLWAPNIPASKTLVYGDSSLVSRGYMKLAADNKIYIASITIGGVPYPDTLYNYCNQRLSVIENPDNSAATCGYAPFSFYLGGRGRSYWSLPNNPNYGLGKVTGGACDSLTGISNIAQGSFEISINPNPANGFVSIAATPQLTKNIEATLLDISGRILKKFNIDLSTGNAVISVSDIESGLYFITIKINEHETVSKKLFIIK